MSEAVTISVQDNLAELNSTFDLYWKLKKKSLTGMLQHVAKNFRVFLVQELKKIAPGAPAIESQNLARLKKGESGMRVSERAKQLVAKKFGLMNSPVTGAGYVVALGKTGGFLKRQKQLLESATKRGGIGGNIQALRVAQEIRLRKSHNLFLASSALFKGDMSKLTYSLTKGGSKLGMMRTGSSDSEDQASAEFVWGNAVGKYSVMANEGLQKPKGQTSIGRALAATTRDMQDYINDKLFKAQQRQLKNQLTGKA